MESEKKTIENFGYLLHLAHRFVLALKATRKRLNWAQLVFSYAFLALDFLFCLNVTSQKCNRKRTQNRSNLDSVAFETYRVQLLT